MNIGIFNAIFMILNAKLARNFQRNNAKVQRAYLNHRLELSVGDAIKNLQSVDNFKVFVLKLH